jgi:uncharacterized protein with FMN-binding domain
MAQAGSGGKVTNGVVALSFAAVLAVYSAGFVRTRAAADRLEAQSAERRPAPADSSQAELRAENVRMVVADTSAIAEPVLEPRKKEVAESAPAAAVVHEVPQASASPAVAVSPVPAPANPEPVSAPVIAATPIAPVPAPVPEPTPAQPAAAPIAVAQPAPVQTAVVQPTPAQPAPAQPAPAPPATPKWKDGTYFGWGTSRHGDIQAQVIISGGRIEAATIAQCMTRYPCSVIEMLPPQVAKRQSPDVDYVSRATQSANAFYYAVVQALSKAK